MVRQRVLATAHPLAPATVRRVLRALVHASAAIPSAAIPLRSSAVRRPIARRARKALPPVRGSVATPTPEPTDAPPPIVRRAAERRRVRANARRVSRARTMHAVHDAHRARTMMAAVLRVPRALKVHRRANARNDVTATTPPKAARRALLAANDRKHAANAVMRAQPGLPTKIAARHRNAAHAAKAHRAAAAATTQKVVANALTHARPRLPTKIAVRHRNAVHAARAHRAPAAATMQKVVANALTQSK